MANVISVDDLKNQKDNFVIIDVREADELKVRSISNYTRASWSSDS
jgi:rhodanese-related sulfurtransferase